MSVQIINVFSHIERRKVLRGDPRMPLNLKEPFLVWGLLPTTTDMRLG